MDDGNILSPATGLEHEAAHAVNNKKGVDSKIDNKYGTTEERSVIKGAELKTAKANGELPANHPGRKSHADGQWVVTAPNGRDYTLTQQATVTLAAITLTDSDANSVEITSPKTVYLANGDEVTVQLTNKGDWRKDSYTIDADDVTGVSVKTGSVKVDGRVMTFVLEASSDITTAGTINISWS